MGPGSHPSRPVRIGEATWLVRATQGDWFVAIYVVIGRRVAIVDSGFLPHPAEALVPALRSLGLRLEDVDLILTTHGHADHAGGHSSVVDRSQAAVHLHRGDVHYLQDPATYRRGSGPHDPLHLLAALAQPERAASWESALMRSVGRAVLIDHEIVDGETIDLGSGMLIEARHTPGHTAGSVTFLVRPERLAITGDSVQGRGYRTGLPLYDDPDAYRTSLARIEAIEASRLAMGHGFRTTASSGGGDPIIDQAEIGAVLAESARFPPLADNIARDVVEREPTTLGQAITWFIEALPSPFGIAERNLHDVGLNALLAATLHLRRAGFEAP